VFDNAGDPMPRAQQLRDGVDQMTEVRLRIVEETDHFAFKPIERKG
jgi:hypothetical protein